MSDTSNKIKLVTALFIFLVGCGPTVNGRRSVTPFRTFFYQMVVGFGTVSSPTQDDFPRGIVIDSSGNTYVCGETYGSLFATVSGTADIFIAKYNLTGTQVWAKQLNSAYPGITSAAAYDNCYGIAIDSSNTYLYIGGYTQGSLFGTTAGGTDFYAAKLNSSDGSLVWGYQYGTTGNDRAYNVTIDSSSNVYLFGTTDLNLGGAPGTQDVMAVKVNSNGTLGWANQFLASTYPSYISGATGNETSSGIVVGKDSSGNENLFFGGYTDNAFVLGANHHLSNDSYFGSLDTNGNMRWLYQIGQAGDYPNILSANSNDQLGFVYADNASNVYVVGKTTGGLISTNDGGNDLFIIKANQTNGQPFWMKMVNQTTYGSVITSASGNEGLAFGGNNSGAVTTDSSGNIYITGATDGNFLGTNVGAPNRDIILVKLNASGSWVWGKQLTATTYPSNIADSSQDDFPYAIFSTTDGNIGLAASTKSNFVTTNGGLSDGLLIHINSDGTL